MRKGFFSILTVLFVFIAAGTEAEAQITQRTLLAKADSAMLAYDFQKAADLYGKAMEHMDSTALPKAEQKLMAAQNGLSMMDFCSTPTVVAKQVFPLKDFFLYYPLANNGWRRCPNQLDSLASKDLPAAVYYPQGAKDIYYSAADSDGIRNIYKTSHGDSLWSVPALINESVTSSSDEVYPMISPDGKTLTFASKGLYGMGGYDLYQSSWNPETHDWDIPVNMGFPYSSPYDDFLFINTEDGKYSIFASNRECQRDSVCIYVLEYDVMPVRKSISSIKELRKLSMLPLDDDPTRMDNSAAISGSGTEDAEQRQYVDKMKEVRMMRDSISLLNKRMDAMRNNLSSTSGKEREDLTKAIMESELAIPELDGRLSRLVKELQEIEMDFLMKGIVLDSKKIQEQADKEIVGASSAYTFSKNSYGPGFSLEMEKPVSRFDYSFMILPEGRFAEDNTLPEGLVYQIQIFTQSRKAVISDLNGLSPVFEKLNPSGKYTYSVGVFRFYADALGNLNKVKGKGFHTAIITAFLNGKPIGTAKAREMESKVSSLYIVKIHPSNGQSLKDDALTAIQAITDKDLVKTVENGSVVYKVGPFEDKADANEILSAVKASGETSVSIIDTLK